MSERKWLTLVNAYCLNIGGKGAEILYFLLLVSLLSKSELGQFNALMTVSLFFLTFIDFGMSQVALRIFSQEKISIWQASQQAAPVRLIFLFLVLMVIVLAYSLDYISRVEAIVMSILCIYQAFNFAHLLLLDAIRGENKQTTANQIVTLEAIFKLVILFALRWKFSIIDLLDVVTSLLSIKIIMFAVTYLLTSHYPNNSSLRIQHRFNPIVFPNQLNFLWIALLTAVQNRLDWLMVSFYMDSSSVATYSVINRYFEILLFVMGIGFTTLYPWLCRAAITGDSVDTHLLRVLRRLQYLPVPLLVAAAIVAFPWINTIFWEGRYEDAGAANAWLLPCAGLAVGNMMLYYDLMAHGEERILIRTCTVSTVLQAGFNLWAIPHYGMMGAIAGMWLMNFANILFFSVACYRRIYVPIELIFNVSIAVLMSGVLVLTGQLLPGNSLLIATSVVSGLAILILWSNRQRLLNSRMRSLA